MGKAEEKQIVRKQVLTKRATLSVKERAYYSAQAAHHLLQLEPLAKCRTIQLFYPFRDEIDTRPFIEEALRRGQEIWLPVTDSEAREIIPYVYTSEQGLRQGVWGILEPDPQVSRRAEPEKLEAIVVPGVAFDRSGGRVGYGGGYYDRFLAKLERKPLLIGLAFSCQLIEQVPLEEHDYLLDYLVTENGIELSPRSPKSNRN
jgi:5-formyltetrahydrofolate cyclo-ligase